MKIIKEFTKFKLECDGLGENAYIYNSELCNGKHMCFIKIGDNIIILRRGLSNKNESKDMFMDIASKSIDGTLDIFYIWEMQSLSWLIPGYFAKTIKAMILDDLR